MRTRRRDDSGFALLLIFLMASMIAISLYMELPRAAFQAERQREQLLMERGEEYKRAIGLFLRTNKNTRWPASIEELENFNNRRSLRKRYIDPMTGKDEWRLIHIQNGVLTDSVTNKPPNTQNQQAGLIPSGMINELQGFGQQTGTQQAVNAGTRRRASDGGTALGPDGQPLPAGAGAVPAGGLPPGIPGATGATGTSGATGLPGAPTGPQNAPGMGGIPGFPTVPVTGGQPNNPNSGGLTGGLMGGGLGGLMGGGLGGTPTQPTGPGGAGGIFGTGIPGANGAPNGASNNGQNGIQAGPSAQSAAAGLLQNLLTQPRPGGLAGITSAQGGGAVMGGGIAGVASKAEGESIMVYGDRSDFSEWEFIYDPMKFRVPPNPSSSSASGIGVPASQLGSNAGLSAPGTAIGTGPGGTQAIGGPGGIGGIGGAASGFGSAPGGAGGAFGASPGGIGASGGGFGMGGIGGATGATNTFGTSASTLGGSASPAGSSGTSGGTGGSTMPAGGGSSAFGQAGMPDIRPGKK